MWSLAHMHLDHWGGGCSSNLLEVGCKNFCILIISFILSSVKWENGVINTFFKKISVAKTNLSFAFMSTVAFLSFYLKAERDKKFRKYV